MDAEFEFDSELNDSFSPSSIKHTSPYSARDDGLSEVDQLKRNLKSALKDARKKITTLRTELEERDRLLDKERNLRIEAERELNEKSEDLLRQQISSSFPLNSSQEYQYLSESKYQDQYETERFMKEELTSMRKYNSELRDKISDLDGQLNIARMSRDEIVATTEAKIQAQAAALVDKIYRAQKERDNAVNARLRVAGEEREDLLARLKRMEKEGFDSGVDSVYDEDDYNEPSVKDLLNRMLMSESGGSITKNGDLLVDRLKNSQKPRKQRGLTDDVRTIIEERDAAFEKIRKLEAQMEQLQSELNQVKNQHRMNEKSRIKATQVQLLSAEQDRDASIQKARKLEDELQSLRIYYSLHKSLSQEEKLRDQFNCTIDSFEDRLKFRESELQIAQRNFEGMASNLQSMAVERNNLAMQLQESMKANQQERERADKLERLVNVLRKRVTSMGGSGHVTLS